MARHADRLAFFVLLVIAGLRPLIGETFRTAGDSMLVLEGAGDPWAAATLAIDGGLLGASACILLPRLWRRRYRPCGLELGAVLFVAAGVVSCAAAPDKRPAINATLDWVATLVAALALVQVLDQVRLRRVALAVVVAGGAVNLALGIEQLVAGFAETEQMYRQQREDIWGRQGVPLDSPQVKLFERRLAAREVSGQFFHSNIAAASWLLAGFAALAAASLASDRRRLAGALLASAALLGICYWTGSKAALAALFFGLALAGLAWKLAPRLAGRGRLVWGWGWAAVFAGGAATVALGIAGDGLPGSSLDFRWQYWTASAQLFADHALTGVGAENFGDHYLAYKSLASPEEVKNPHNFLVHFATEYGVLGLAALLAMLLGGSWRIARRAPSLVEPEQRDAPAGSMRHWGLVLAIAIFLLRTFELPSLNYYLVVWSTFVGVTSWTAGYALIAWALGDGSATGRSPAAAGALAAGLLAFLLQDLVNFALFVPATRTTFFVLVSLALAGRTAPRDSEKPADAGAAPWAARGVLACLAAGVVAWMVNFPIAARAEMALRAARGGQVDARYQTQDAGTLYAQATRSDPLDATPPFEAARFHLARALADSAEPSRSLIDAALENLHTAQARAPRRLALWRMESQVQALRARLAGDVAAWQAAAEAMRTVIGLYPNRPDSYAELAEVLFARGDCPSAAEAVASWQKALELDAAKPEWEQFHRFSAAERAALGERLAAARAWLDDECH